MIVLLYRQWCANWRLDNAKSPAAMLQEKPTQKPHMLPVADVVRTYIPQVAYLFSSFDTWYALCVYSYVQKRKHSTAQQHSKNNENESEIFGKEKNLRPLSCDNFCLIGRPCTGQKEETKKSNRR